MLDRAAADDVVGKMNPSPAQSLPGVGKVRAQQIMEKLEIAETRRLQGPRLQAEEGLLAEMTGDEPAD